VRTLSLAERLLQELGVTEPNEIDLEAIAWHVGVRVRYENLDSCEARILGYGNRAIVTIDPRRSRRRLRFSLAHELGHWRLHRGQSFICRPDDIGNANRGVADPERMADGYAADLILPEYLFRPRARRAKQANLDLAKELSEIFDVSLTATALRLVEFGPEPLMLVCHTPRRRKWFKASKDVPSRWFPMEHIDPESPSFDVLYGKIEQSRRSLIGADAWFDCAGADRFEIHEQSIRINSDEMLSFITFKDERMLGGA